MSKERPILFNAEMVRAVLDGRKTQTRRVVKKLLKLGPITEFKLAVTAGYNWMFRDKRALWNELRHQELLKLCPYDQPGDRLWVRETFATGVMEGMGDFGGAPYDFVESKGPLPKRSDGHECFYREGFEETTGWDKGDIERWRPSIHMPRWASRITLEITEVRAGS